MKIYRDEQLGKLIYREYYEWFDLNNAANGVMTFYTYGAARYSALPMDINGTLEHWATIRLKELQLERNVFWSDYDYPISGNYRKVSKRKFERMLEDFKNISPHMVVKEVVSGWVEKDYEFAWEQFGNALDFEQIFLMNSLYDVAFHKWLTVREEIAACLGSEQQKTYRELTMRVMSRLYNDLKGLKEIRY